MLLQNADAIAAPISAASNRNVVPFEDVRNWMFESALPFWADCGVDQRRGGFYEDLDFDGRATATPFKRTRTMCRQVYVFAHAAHLGWREGLALSEMGFAYLVRQTRLDFGYAKRLSADGAVLDAAVDLYDLSFVLFAFSWRYRVSQDPATLKLMHELLDFIEVHMAHPGGEGYVHALPCFGPRVQNPHMHLLEACLAAFEATQDQVFLDRADDIVDLFQRRFFDGSTLGEHFNDDWSRLSGEQGRLVEPGHQFEWAWILAQHAKHSRRGRLQEAWDLVSFAETYGVSKHTQATYNLIRDDGVALDRGSRTWPNTERLKGHLALFEAWGSDTRVEIAGSVNLLLKTYLNAAPCGAWQDEFSKAN
jgi:N-acylglucosamine 2-epimerase/mannose-6-phosphate isomerase